jgi:hypothetical protein
MKYEFYKIFNNTGRLQVDGKKCFILRNGILRFLEKGATLVAILHSTRCYELNYRSNHIRNKHGNLVYFDVIKNKVVERGRFVMVGRNMFFMLEESSPYA